MIRKNLEVQMHHNRSLGIEVGQADWRWPRFDGSLFRVFRSLSFVPPSHGTFWGGLGSSFGQGTLPQGVIGFAASCWFICRRPSRSARLSRAGSQPGSGSQEKPKAMMSHGRNVFPRENWYAPMVGVSQIGLMHQAACHGPYAMECFDETLGFSFEGGVEMHIRGTATLIMLVDLSPTCGKVVRLHVRTGIDMSCQRGPGHSLVWQHILKRYSLPGLPPCHLFVFECGKQGRQRDGAATCVVEGKLLFSCWNCRKWACPF